MKFVDEVTIEAKSGDGGAGSVHFMRQIYMPMMGPDGGDGGRGGHVYFEATHNLQSLLDFKYNPRYFADDGEKGSGMDCNGRNAEDLVVNVPIGTTLRDADTGEFLADLVEDGVRILLLKGGRGGLGNMNFATPTRQAPDFAQPGRPGQSRKIKLELKLMADVGLVGFPNAGKSTLISRMSAARPKIADYPFTTLVPNLGVVRSKGLDFVMADIPGIIEGAADGKGLGVQFLKHCERTRLLVLMLDLDPSTGRNLHEEYSILQKEMKNYSEELSHKPQILVLNKIDAFTQSLEDPLLELFLKERNFDELKKLLPPNKKVHMISAVSGMGLEDLKAEIDKALTQMGPRTWTNQLSTTLQLGNPELLES